MQGSDKEEEEKTLHRLPVLGINEDLWGRVRGVDNEIWNGCEGLIFW